MATQEQKYRHLLSQGRALGLANEGPLGIPGWKPAPKKTIKEMQDRGLMPKPEPESKPEKVKVKTKAKTQVVEAVAEEVIEKPPIPASMEWRYHATGSPGSPGCEKARDKLPN